MLPTWYLDYKKLIDNSVKKYLEKYFESEKNPGLDIIKKATIYACKGGKRIRSILAIEFYLIFSGKKFKDLSFENDIIKLCVAIELLHAYSLVHDDLPAMDNDLYRRGELTVWKKFGETNAILVGDLLNSMSFEIIGTIKNSKILSYYFGKAISLKGMIGGQVLDLFYEKNSKKLTLENLIEIHNKKTGALIEFSVISGILLVDETLKDGIKKFINFGKKIGLAFQIKDDLLDVEGSFEETGKSVGDGEKKGFVYFMGVKKTRQYLEDIIKECENIIKDLNSEKLNFLVTYIKERKV